MREMKDSGVEWIGAIPKDWDIIQIKKILASRDGGSWGEEPQEDQLDRICYRVADFDFSRLAIVSDAEFTIRNYTQPIIDKLSLERGDILVEKSGGGDKTPVGRAVFFDKDEPALFANFIERLRVATETSPRYFFYVWIALYLTGFTYNYIKQTTGIQNLDIKSLVSSVYVPSFDLNLQHRIADYLDAKCAQIDRAIARQQEVIEKLKEYKLSVITEAVTKGLNPDVPMKDSGIEWIGEIPEHWDTFRIAALYREVYEAGNDDLPILSVSINTGVSDRELEDEEQDRVFVRSDDKSKYKRVQIGDLTYNMMRAWQGAFGAVRVEGMVSPAYVVARPHKKEGLDSRYIEYLLRTTAAKEEMRRYSHGIADFRLRLYWAYFKSMKICFPEKHEQEDIADYIDKKLAQIDAIITQKDGLIIKLAEFKKSLIYEVVTGKREV